MRVPGAPRADEELAVAYFGDSSARSGFLSPDQASVAIEDYCQHRPIWRESLLQEAHRLSHIGFPIYSMVVGPLARGLDWSTLPNGKHNDRLYRLRPHRFGFLPRLAIAASLGADTLPALLATLERWIAHAETTDGAIDGYFSNLVIIYRLLAISWAVPFITLRARGGDRTAAITCLRLFQILAADLKHLHPRLGRSVANNHLLADRFAAWFLATCYSDLWPRSDRRELERAWLEELGRQFQADGTNFEQSLHYHELGCEMALAYLVITLRAGAGIPADASALIGRMLRFQAAMADERGSSFRLGDATDDSLLPLDADAGWAGGAWRILYREWFDASFPRTDNGAQGAERAFWLLTALRDVDLPLRSDRVPAPLGYLAAFPDNGYVVLRDDVDQQHLLFRTGPRPGAKTSPGHAMSDLLTIYWNVSGQPVLEPAGTYSYAATGSAGNPAPSPGRDYFRGPASHNGLVLRGHDPLGQATTRFREGDKGTRVRSRWGSVERVLGWAEGQLEEAGPLNGYQRGLLHVPGCYALVYDALPPLPHAAELAEHWQLAPEAKVALPKDRRAVIRLDNLEVHACASDGIAAITCVQGRSQIAAGWVSRRYGELAPAPQLICGIRAEVRRLAFVFSIAGQQDEGPARVEIVDEKEERCIIAVRYSRRCDFVLLGGFAGCLPGSSCDLQVQGDILWLRFEEDSCREVRGLGLHHVSSEALGVELGGVKSSTMQSIWRTIVREENDTGISGQWRRAT